MTNRKQKIEELVESMSSFKRNMAFRGIGEHKAPKITPSQWGVLMLIGQSSEVSVKEVASILHISSSATTQLVDGLVKNGYVIRKEQIKDRRAVVLTLSQKTKNQFEKMKTQMIQSFLGIFEALTDKEFNQFCFLHKKIAQGFLKKNKANK